MFREQFLISPAGRRASPAAPTASMEYASDITGVPLGRTEAIVVPNDAPSRELSHVQGLGVAPFHSGFKSWVFHVSVGFPCFFPNVFWRFS